MDIESPQLILEKLDSIEARLIVLENVSDEGIDINVAVHLLFRDFHNLKSSLSMGGADFSAKLIHQAESCLDALRAGKGDSGSDWVDLLLAVVDRVRKAMETDEETESPALSGRLEDLLAAWLYQEKKQTREIGFPLNADEAQALQEALSSGLVPHVLEKLIREEMDVATVETLPVFEAVNEAGSLIARRLIRVKGSGSVLTVVFATDKTAEDLSLIIFDPCYPVDGSRNATRADARSSKGKKTGDTALPDFGKLKRILIVDDEPVALMLLQHYLSPYGRIDTAESGSEAMEKFGNALKGKDPYRVIFLDIVIPGIPGDTVLEQIRKQEREAGIPPGEGTRIVMASSLQDYSCISASFQNQCDAYLVKPIEAQTIEDTMAKLGFAKTVLPFIAIPKSRKHG